MIQISRYKHPAPCKRCGAPELVWVEHPVGCGNVTLFPLVAGTWSVDETMPHVCKNGKVVTVPKRDFKVNPIVVNAITPTPTATIPTVKCKVCGHELHDNVHAINSHMKTMHPHSSWSKSGKITIPNGLKVKVHRKGTISIPSGWIDTKMNSDWTFEPRNGGRPGQHFDRTALYDVADFRYTLILPKEFLPWEIMTFLESDVSAHSPQLHAELLLYFGGKS